ncbi:MAG TPA: extracellular solute-binding protein, partial [Limnochordia bacterium]|nr:extracellular solute-binding protein [Limnochordia bacterium]
PGQWGALVLYAGPLTGLRFGIPHYTNSEVMYFNKDLFDAAGLTYPDAAEKSGSWDWNTFRLDAKKMTVRDAAGKTTQWGFSPYRWPMWVYGAGGKIFNYPEDVTQFTLNQPAAVNGLKFLHDLMWVDQVAPSGGGAKVNMAGGKAGLADYWGSCCIGGLLQGINGTYHLGMANLPVGPTGERHAQVFNDMFVITKNTKYPRVAWDVLKFMTSPEGARILSQYERLQPSRYSAIQTFAKLFPEVDAEVAAETAMSAYPSYDVVIPDPAHVTPVVNKVLADSVWNNTTSIQTAVDAAAKQVNGIIAAYMKR